VAALGRAEQALGQAGPEGEEPDWARYIDEAQLADEHAHCFRDLEDHRRAREFAERSLELRNAEYTRSMLFCRTVLATALLGLGELDQACEIEAEATEFAGGLRSARAMDYVREFSHRLTPYRDSPAVRGFAERTDEFLCAAS
ncbi:MAG TPA: regulator, partial [Yinghuangia sp.]|nr:regulator [Yinghuangia sp.]